MELEIILILVWAIIMTATLGILVAVILNLKKKHDQDIRDKEDEIIDLVKKLEKKQKSSFQMGVNTTSGDYTQILGDFAILSKYDQIITLSTTSKQPSLDLIGISDESLDFLELKKKGARITSNENKVKRLVDEKKVSYKVFDIELPENFSITERIPKVRIAKELPKKLTREERHDKKEEQKIEAKKEHATAYEPWTNSDDTFLTDYWNDESNKKSSGEKIQELSTKLDRTEGGVRSRIKKLGLR